jgi:hypothetical protein
VRFDILFLTLDGVVVGMYVSRSIEGAAVGTEAIMQGSNEVIPQEGSHHKLMALTNV